VAGARGADYGAQPRALEGDENRGRRPEKWPLLPTFPAADPESTRGSGNAQVASTRSPKQPRSGLPIPKDAAARLERSETGDLLKVTTENRALFVDRVWVTESNPPGAWPGSWRHHLGPLAVLAEADPAAKAGWSTALG